MPVTEAPTPEPFSTASATCCRRSASAPTRPSGSASSPRRRSRSSRRRASSGCSSRSASTASRPTRSTSTPRSATSPRRVRLDRLGLQRGRRAPVAGRAVRRRGAAGGLGRATPRPGCSSSYAPTGKAVRHRRRLHAVGQVELLLRLRPLRVGAARRAGVQRRRARSSTSRPSWCPREHYQIVDVWNVVGLRGTGSNDIVVDEVLRARGVHAVDERHRPLLRPRPGAEHLRPLQAAVPLDLHRHHHHADHRHGDGRRTPSTSRCSRSACARRTSARRRASTRSPPSGSRGRPRRSTPPGRCWSTTSARSRPTSRAGRRSRSRLRLKVRRDQVLGTQRAIDAIDALFEASGGRALAEGTYLQRAWRDAHAGRVHAANDPERALQMYGAHEFGHKVDPGMY